MKLLWRNKYVEDGVLEPDKFNRWLRIGYVKAERAALEHVYPKHVLDAFEDHLYVTLCAIHQKGTVPGIVMSTMHRFAASVPRVSECLNIGIGWEWYIYGDTVEEVERQAEERFNELHRFFLKLAE